MALKSEFSFSIEGEELYLAASNHDSNPFLLHADNANAKSPQPAGGPQMFSLI